MHREKILSLQVLFRLGSASNQWWKSLQKKSMKHTSEAVPLNAKINSGNAAVHWRGCVIYTPDRQIYRYSI